MKKAKKILALLLCAALLVGATIAGTLAYLTDTDDATNTFTIGKVDIELQEYEVDNQTGKKTTEVVEGLEDVELVPGRIIEKNPFITVAADSEDCWLFVYIENGLEGAGEITMADGWTAVDGKTGYYRYGKTVSANTKVDVFTQFICNKLLGNTEIAAFEGKTIKITAYAVQAEGVTMDAAWGALDQHYFD